MSKAATISGVGHNSGDLPDHGHDADAIAGLHRVGDEIAAWSLDVTPENAATVKGLKPYERLLAQRNGLLRQIIRLTRMTKDDAGPAIMALISSLSDNEYGRSNISVPRLARILGRDVRSIERSIRKLVNGNYIMREKAEGMTSASWVPLSRCDVALKPTDMLVALDPNPRRNTPGVGKTPPAQSTGGEGVEPPALSTGGNGQPPAFECGTPGVSRGEPPAHVLTNSLKDNVKFCASPLLNTANVNTSRAPAHSTVPEVSGLDLGCDAPEFIEIKGGTIVAHLPYENQTTKRIGVAHRAVLAKDANALAERLSLSKGEARQLIIDVFTGWHASGRTGSNDAWLTQLFDECEQRSDARSEPEHSQSSEALLAKITEIKRALAATIPRPHIDVDVPELPYRKVGGHGCFA